MAEIVQKILKHPTDPDKTLDEVLHDVVNRNKLGRVLVAYEYNSTEVVLKYQSPD